MMNVVTVKHYLCGIYIIVFIINFVPLLAGAQWDAPTEWYYLFFVPFIRFVSAIIFAPLLLAVIDR